MTDDTEFKFARRAADASENTDAEILALIQKAGDGPEKAHLMVLFNLNRNVIHNTDVTVEIARRQIEDEKNLEEHRKEFADHRVEFKQHVEDERVLFAKGIGAWKAVSLVSLTLFAMSGYIFKGHLDSLTRVIAQNETQDARVAEQDKRLSLLEAAVTRNTAILLELERRAVEYRNGQNQTGSRK